MDAGHALSRRHPGTYDLIRRLARKIGCRFRGICGNWMAANERLGWTTRPATDDERDVSSPACPAGGGGGGDDGLRNTVCYYKSRTSCPGG